MENKKNGELGAIDNKLEVKEDKVSVETKVNMTTKAKVEKEVDENSNTTKKENLKKVSNIKSTEKTEIEKIQVEKVQLEKSQSNEIATEIAEKEQKKEAKKTKRTGKVLLVSKSYIVVDDGQGHGISLNGIYKCKPGEVIEY